MDNIESLQKENKALKKEIERLKSDEDSVRVTHQEQADYQESQVRFRTIFESSRLGNKIIGSDLKILQVNPALVTLLGYKKKEEIIGTYILDYTPSEFYDRWKKLQTQLWSLNTPSLSFETCLRKKDGSIVWCNVTSILFQDQGKTMGYTIIEDISMQHESEKHKEDFIRIASHELKTPLTSLQAVLQLMNRTIKNETVISDKLVELSGKSESYMIKLGKLVNDLLDFSRFEKGRVHLNITRFKFSELTENCCKHIRSEGKYNITYLGDPSLEMEADESKINQVLVNLVNNAVRYAPESLEITVAVEELKNFIKVSVSDKGKGIPPEKLPHLFQSYYQANHDGNRGSGLGLGLFISAEIIKNHGGEIGVFSKLEEGSTFWFTIPKTINQNNEQPI